MCDLYVNFLSTWIPTNFNSVFTFIPYSLYCSAIYGYMVYVLCIAIKYHMPSFIRVYIELIPWNHKLSLISALFILVQASLNVTAEASTVVSYANFVKLKVL